MNEVWTCSVCGWWENTGDRCEICGADKSFTYKEEEIYKEDDHRYKEFNSEQQWE